MVYYSGAVGIVFDKTLWDKKQPCQKFFFGHDNDIEWVWIQQKVTRASLPLRMCNTKKLKRHHLLLFNSERFQLFGGSNHHSSLYSL